MNGEDAVMQETESTFSRQNLHQDYKIELMVTKCTLPSNDAAHSKVKTREAIMKHQGKMPKIATNESETDIVLLQDPAV